MKYFFKVLSKIIILNAVFLFLMSVFRVIFFFYYGKGIDFTGFGADIFKAFYMGARYDSAVLGYINVLIVLSICVLLFIGSPAYFKKLFSIAKWYYALIIGSVFVFLYIDFEFYGYFQSHLNILAYGIVDDDTNALLSTFNENYNLFLIGLLFISFYVLTFFISRQILKLNKNIIAGGLPKGIIKKIIIFIVLGLLNFALIRNSFQMFPIGLPQAEISSNAFLNKVGINGFYTLEDAFVVRSEENNIDYIEQSGYKDNIRQAFADFLDKDITEIPQYNPEDSLIKNLPYNKDIEDIKPNVIVIIMESFGADLIKYQSEEFNILGELKKHFDEDLVFMNFVPGHHVTIGSIEAVTTNIARKPMSPYLSQSKYIYQKYQFSGPRPYKAKGYESIFIYGGNMGWRGLEPFMLSLGFDEVLGDGAMDSKYPRNQWGIFDEYLFQYVYEALDSGEQSKFITVMTITNHPPFSLPQNYKPGSLIAPQSLNERIQNKELAQKRFETYQYANEAVGQFISKIKNSKYADNTIIVVTGDHNFWGLFQYLTQELFDSISVPFYLYIPPKLKPSNIDTAIVGSHLDILPTVYSVSLSSISYMAMGSNLLSKDAQNHIASHDSGIIFDKTDIVQYDFQNGNAAYFVWSQNSPREVLPSEERDGHKRLLKRFLSQTAISDYLIKYAGE